jgi:4-hydroxyphenylpyruvate dioxygenase
VDQHPPALTGLHWFGIVQYIDADRMEDWCAFYGEVFGFVELPDDKRFGIMPNGKILASPCKSFYLQLVDPAPGLLDFECEEILQRIGLGAPSVPQAMAALHERGVDFLESGGVHSNERGALTQHWMGSVTFELVHDLEAADRQSA